MTKEEVLTLLDSLPSYAQRESPPDPHEFVLLKEGIRSNQEHFSDEQVKRIVTLLVIIGEWRFAEDLVRGWDCEDVKGYLSILGVRLIEEGLLAEAEEFARPIPEREDLENTIICKLDILEALTEKYSDNQKPEKASAVLAAMEQVIPILGDKMHDYHVQVWSTIGTLWWTRLEDHPRAIKSWHKAVDHVNRACSDFFADSMERTLTRKAISVIAVSITRCAGVKLAEDILSSLVDENNRKRSIEIALEFSALES